MLFTHDLPKKEPDNLPELCLSLFPVFLKTGRTGLHDDNQIYKQHSNLMEMISQGKESSLRILFIFFIL